MPFTLEDLFGKGGFGKFLGGAANAGIGAYGYGELQDRLDKDRDAVRGSIKDITAGVQEAGAFTPWSVRSGLGKTSFNPETGELVNNLSQRGLEQRNMMASGSAANWARANADPAGRETEIYERLRAMQRPGEQRQYDSMNAGLFGSGRGGMRSSAYGGSPEQHAFGLAQAEARNTASYQAMGQAQQEMQNYAQLADMQFKNQYMPQSMLQEQAKVGMQNNQIYDASKQNMAGLLAQLGLGGTTAEANYSTIQGESLVGLLRMLGAGASGALGAIK